MYSNVSWDMINEVLKNIGMIVWESTSLFPKKIEVKGQAFSLGCNPFSKMRNQNGSSTQMETVS